MQNDAHDRYKEEFVKRYGTVSRARGCYLYTQKGVRITDLYLDGGRAILGRSCSASRAFKVFKNTIDRGQTGLFPNMYETRFEKAALSLLKGFAHARWFASEESLSHAVLESPWITAALWRPWNGRDDELIEADAVAVCIPFALCGSGYAVLFKDKNGALPPSSDECSPALLNAASRALYDLAHELPLRGEEDFALFDSVLARYFTRHGAYLVPKVGENRYREFFLHCLDCALLLPPVCALPAIVPVGASLGDFSQLKRAVFEY